MDKHETKNQIDYIVMCVSEFANRFKLTNQQAYAYLRRFSGIELITQYENSHAASESQPKPITDRMGILKVFRLSPYVLLFSGHFQRWLPLEYKVTNYF